MKKYILFENDWLKIEATQLQKGQNAPPEIDDNSHIQIEQDDFGIYIKIQKGVKQVIDIISNTAFVQGNPLEPGRRYEFVYKYDGQFYTLSLTVPALTPLNDGAVTQADLDYWTEEVIKNTLPIPELKAKIDSAFAGNKETFQMTYSFPRPGGTFVGRHTVPIEENGVCKRDADGNIEYEVLTFNKKIVDFDSSKFYTKEDVLVSVDRSMKLVKELFETLVPNLTCSFQWENTFEENDDFYETETRTIDYVNFATVGENGVGDIPIMLTSIPDSTYNGCTQNDIRAYKYPRSQQTIIGKQSNAGGAYELDTFDYNLSNDHPNLPGNSQAISLDIISIHENLHDIAGIEHSTDPKSIMNGLVPTGVTFEERFGETLLTPDIIIATARAYGFLDKLTIKA